MHNAFQNTKREVVHHWDGQNLVMEISADTGQTKAKYLRGANLICQVIDLSLLFYLFNAHGDVVQRVSASGEKTSRYEYDAFGNLLKRTMARANPADHRDTDPNPFRYCGEYWDTDMAEYYLRARTYNPATGRFSQEDIAKDGTNWYAYCGGNPVTRHDQAG